MDIRTKRLRDAFEATGMSQTELCEKTGINKGAFSSYLSGRYFPKQKTLEKLSEVLGVSIQYLMGLNTLEPVNIPEIVPVPVLGCIHAGKPVLAQECVEDTPVYIPKDWTIGGMVYRGLRVKGDSMMPKIQNGDRVIFRVTPDCENGDIVIARIDGEEATIKKIVKSSGAVTLQPLNPAYDTVTFTGDASEPELEILGVVVQLVRDI